MSKEQNKDENIFVGRSSTMHSLVFISLFSLNELPQKRNWHFVGPKTWIKTVKNNFVLLLNHTPRRLFKALELHNHLDSVISSCHCYSVPLSLYARYTLIDRQNYSESCLFIATLFTAVQKDVFTITLRAGPLLSPFASSCIALLAGWLTIIQ